MAQYVATGKTVAVITPLVYHPRTATPRFVRLADGFSEAVPTLMAELPTEEPGAIVEAVVDELEAVVETVNAPTEEPRAVVSKGPETVANEQKAVVDAPEPSSMLEPEPVPMPTPAPSVVVKHTPLSINLQTIRRTLGLTPEEFARPIIDDGEGLINRLEAGFSRASAEVSKLITDAWSICPDYLFSGTGPMFEKDKPSADYTSALVKLLRQYLSVATFDKKGHQYWKGSLVTDLLRLIDVNRLDGRGMARVVRVMFDYLDVDQFAEILERMSR